MTIVAGLDLETTGLEFSEGHRIIEVAVVLYILETQKKVGSFVRRINPERPISAGAQAVHGITFEELTKEPKWGEVAPSLRAVLARCGAIVAHNGEGFDMPFVNYELARIGLPVLDVPVVDTMLQARWATPLGKLPNLGELCFACSVDYDTEQAHGAEYDTDVMMQCFFKAHSKGFMKLPILAAEPERIAA